VSLLIIIGHVKDGIELAREYNLPTSIFPFIQQHHGTTLVEYFYHRACNQPQQPNCDAPAISETQYRYPGPKPRSKECAIVMIADAAESATRAMTEPNAPRIEQLVEDLIMKRLLDGQFDECDLTMRELETIRRACVKILLGIYHGRIAYPSNAARRTPAPSQPRPPSRPREEARTQEAAWPHGRSPVPQVATLGVRPSGGAACAVPSQTTSPRARDPRAGAGANCRGASQRFAHARPACAVHGHRRSTDVLTFELDHDAAASDRRRSDCVRTGGPASGEVAGIDLRMELLLYALHGVLHLCGFDDTTERGFRTMHRREDDILTQLGFGPVFAPPACRGLKYTTRERTPDEYRICHPEHRHRSARFAAVLHPDLFACAISPARGSPTCSRAAASWSTSVRRKNTQRSDLRHRRLSTLLEHPGADRVLLIFYERTRYPVRMAVLSLGGRHRRDHAVLLRDRPARLSRHAAEHIIAVVCGDAAWASRDPHAVTKLMHLTDALVERAAARGGDDEPQKLEQEIEQEIIAAVEEGAKEGVVDDDERAMIESVIAFHNTQVGQIMTPRPEIFALDVKSTLEA
jgi:hypothetical protein